MILEIKNLTIEFKTRSSTVHAVNNVNLTLDDRDRLGIVGESGSGKSTLAYSILRLLADNARISGRILYNTHDLVSIPEPNLDQLRWQKIAMVFQNSMNALNPVTRIGKQLIDALQLHKNIQYSEAREIAADMIEKVGIPAKRLMDFPHEYSGGMKQRAVLALALICHPEILIADEPTTALDVVAQRQVLQLLMELQKELGLSVIFISHDISTVAEFSNKIAVMYAGEIVEYGTTFEVFNHSQHPYTEALVAAFPSLHRPIVALKEISGHPPNMANLPEGCPFEPRCSFSKELCKFKKPDFVPCSNGSFCRCHLPRG
ncbi:MAG: ABC transporter ATP-binding protein [Eubacteriales bacterium]|nr:ABC transporter ATP-binding protein [Clostridiales bacterium]MDY5835643.1 ABC transporter ATP-binding protein [Eubacteriales bacterium]